MVDGKLSVAVVGLGRAGHVHLRSLVSLSTKARIAWVVDLNAETAARVAAVHECKATTDIDDALADADLDAVIICSATYTHFDFTMRALNARKAVFTEKPISHDPAELEEVLDVAMRSNLVFCTGYQRRCDKNFRALKQQLDSGAIGSVRLIKCTSRCAPLAGRARAPRAAPEHALRPAPRSRRASTFAHRVRPQGQSRAADRVPQGLRRHLPRHAVPRL